MSMSENRSADAGAFSLPIEPTPAAVSAARRAFTAWLYEVGIDNGALDDLPVVFSELVTNATAATPQESVQTRAWLEDDDLVVEVENSIDGRWAETGRWDLDDALRGGGRGLVIVRAFTDELHIDADHDVMTVRCRRRTR